MKNKIIGGIAALVIVTLAVANVHVVVNSDVEKRLPISLNVIDKVAYGDGDEYTNKGSKGPATPYTKTCKTHTESTTVTTNNNNNNSGWNATGSAGANWGWGNASASGGYNTGSSTGSSSTTVTHTTSDCSSTRTGYDCPGQNTINCTPYHPC